MRKRVFGHMRTAQSDQGLRCPNHWIPQNVSMERKFPDETVHAWDESESVCILRMLDDTSSLGPAQI